MNIVYMGNNRVGAEVLDWLVEQGERIVGLVVHPDSRARCKDELLAVVSKQRPRIFKGPQLRERATVDAIASLNPDLILSVMFGYILRDNVLLIPKHGCINLHNGYLPYNRGVFANVWSIVERTPAGATLHYMDAGVDTGDIIAQRQVPIDFSDTGQTLHRKTEDACIALFKETWPAIRNGDAPRTPQNPNEGTLHRLGDERKIDHIDVGEMYRAGELIDILRARTFPPHEAAFVIHEGRKYYIRVSIEEAGDA